MKIKVTIVKNNGEEYEYLREIGELDSQEIVNSVEAEVTQIQRELMPFVSERLIEAHQADFVGEKNQEEKRDT